MFEQFCTRVAKLLRGLVASKCLLMLSAEVVGAYHLLRLVGLLAQLSDRVTSNVATELDVEVCHSEKGQGSDGRRSPKAYPAAFDHGLAIAV